VEDFIETFWEAFFIKCDANNLLAQTSTWLHNDISAYPHFGGRFRECVSLDQSSRDPSALGDRHVFPPVDNEYEAKHMPNAELRPIPTIWGHMSPMNPEDQPKSASEVGARAPPFRRRRDVDGETPLDGTNSR
jgi:homoserine O-acetyltransferase/O-succinyltransferase